MRKKEDLQDKNRKFLAVRKKLLSAAKRGLRVRDYEWFLSSLACLGRLSYYYNAYYTDNEIEELLSLFLSSLSKKHRPSFAVPIRNRVVFYDGFGLETRGVCRLYLNALHLCGYEVLYLAPEGKKESLTETLSLCQQFGFETRFFRNKNGYMNWILDIFQAINSFQPKSAFFYTTPADVSGAIAFGLFKGVTDRYLIDLTDHAFWIGKNACDFFCGSREMSGYIEHFQRGIPKEKLIRLGVNVSAPTSENHDGLPFNVKEKKYIFSGGSLYKTLGDSNNTYYRLVRHFLDSDPNLFFLYAGEGDRSQFEMLKKDYPDRLFVIPERKDFFYLIQNCVFYLNTYPMFGGMMMKYCALAQKLPLTLKHNNDSDGLLLHQAECQIEYVSYEQLAEDGVKLLNDANYRQYRESLLKDSIITESRFAKNVKSLIEHHRTDYGHTFQKFDITVFQKEFAKRFSLKNAMVDMLSANDKRLALRHPILLVKKVFRRKTK